MADKCKSFNGQSIGCPRIQKMDSAIRKLQKNHSSFFGWIIIGICLLALLIGGLFVYRTFRPISYPTEIRLDVRVDGGGTVSEKEKANIRLELSEALLAMEARAAAAYNEKFATLLTILTIFGIAWPVIIALLQSKFNESQLKNIENSLEFLRDNTQSAIVGLMENVYTKMGGIVAQIVGQTNELEDELYCTFIAFSLLYQGNSDKRNDVLDILSDRISKLKAWSNADKKYQVTSSITYFLCNNNIDDKTCKVIKKILDIANKTEIANKLRKNKVSEPQISEEGK